MAKVMNETSFTVNVDAGSGENYAGAFRVRKRLSHSQVLRRDELRRELLGAKPEFAPVEIQKNAFILSTCAAYVIEGPSWWEDNSNGLDLLDQEPVAAVFEEVTKVIKAAGDELEAKGKKAVEALKGE
jgi:tRNA A37 threonylcarbamoyladenosine modification protein TsaB